MSRLIMRPSGPLPRTLFKSMPSSPAIRMAIGVANRRPPVGGSDGGMTASAADTRRRRRVPSEPAGRGRLCRCRTFDADRGQVTGLAGLAKHADRRPYRLDAAALSQDLQQHAGLERGDFDAGLVGLDNGEHVALVDRVAGLFHPLFKLAFGHVEAKFGHGD